MYSGERLAIPVPLTLADDSISAVMIEAYFISAACAVRMIISWCSNLYKIEMNK
jgi:hypothetical protein